ncbi:contact-dependent growth inhibition system immunity protein [Herbaspirillum rubrisubalbicans]|uniref:DUF1436 domain-containing protein n=1 Tax=Herbaspirillum rubrisubalbicans Os34 TaxID=1235827 RepID=A0A6M3ZV78_9BURK|nr:contact-dependent growth inhibition system immunity protein [Herbaspirillum rubrisubalbicans]QJQ02436.1 DUF1436 domain-containing protein [Herbaspirillum rubrisubalbicans Os34]
MLSNKARANVGFNGDFFEVISISSGMIDFPEPTSEVRYLPDVTNEILGEAVVLALIESKHVSPAVFQEILASGKIQRISEERSKYTLKRYGYKSKKAMLKNMAFCLITVNGGEFMIQPTHHRLIDSFSGLPREEVLSVSLNASNAELGVAIREGIKRCTSALD